MLARRHITDSENHGIDLAPMLDFVVNLLIFFIITAVFVKESGIVLNRSTGLEDSTRPGESTQIQILANGDVVFDGRIVDLQAVRANVERVKSVAPERGILIAAASTAPAGVLVTVADEVRSAGVYDVTFNTEE